jgi:hypothetical protein
MDGQGREDAQKLATPYFSTSGSWIWVPSLSFAGFPWLMVGMEMGVEGNMTLVKDRGELAG